MLGLLSGYICSRHWSVISLLGVMQWPGAAGDEEFSYGTTMYQGIKNLAPKGSTVDFMEGVDIDGKWEVDKDQLIDRAHKADVIVACVGEPAYAEGFGNIQDLVLPLGQEELVVALASTGVPVVVILLEGRPRLLGMSSVNGPGVIRALPCLACPSSCLPVCLSSFLSRKEISLTWRPLSSMAFCPGHLVVWE